MLSFRQKIFAAYLFLFIVFIVLIFPFSTYFVNHIVFKAMEDRIDELLEKIQSAPTDEALIRRLKDQQYLVYFRVSIISDSKQVLYDSHSKRLFGPKFTQEYVVEHPEVINAFKNRVDFHVDYSDFLGQKFYYMAKAFDFHGHTYVIRTAVPYNYVSEMAEDTRIGFIFLISGVLFFFTIITWFIINHLTRPIHEIIASIAPYEAGVLEKMPEIKLKSTNSNSEFYRLANLLNSLSKHIINQINTLTHERNEKSAILESLIEGVVAVDEKMIVTYANHSASKMFGLTQPKFLSQPFQITNHPLCSDLLIRCQQEEKVLKDTLYLRQDGKRVYLDIVAVPKGKNQGAILVLQDQSSHYLVMEMRKEFIANASHELKTPITIIRGFAETLHDNPNLPKGTIADITSKIESNCIRMTQLIKDLLALADIEHLPASRLLDCNLYQLLEKCKQTLLTIFPDAQINIIDKTAQAHIVGDPSLLEMAFNNLLDNAAKYSNVPAKITVILENLNDWIKIDISDEGIGIPASSLDHIFERFYTADKDRSRKMGGSGLGLAIVETIIHKHFGKISVVSKEEEGSTFTLLLPTRLS